MCFCFSDVWNKFLEFESSVGDLSSILKVEKRRAGVIGPVSTECDALIVKPSLYLLCTLYVSIVHAYSQEFEGRETALLIDRYKFLDLLPCSATELRSVGYKVAVTAQNTYCCFCFVCCFVVGNILPRNRAVARCMNKK